MYLFFLSFLSVSFISTIFTLTSPNYSRSSPSSVSIPNSAYSFVKNLFKTSLLFINAIRSQWEWLVDQKASFLHTQQDIFFLLLFSTQNQWCKIFLSDYYSLLFRYQKRREDPKLPHQEFPQVFNKPNCNTRHPSQNVEHFFSRLFHYDTVWGVKILYPGGG